MKKLLCVMILLAFVGSTIVMTGCGSSGGGIGAIFAAVFVIAIVASAGTGAPAIFAANQKPNYRTSIAANITVSTTPTYLKIIPLKDNGDDETSDKHVTVQVEAANVSNGVITRDVEVNDLGHKQYRVEVFVKDAADKEVPLLMCIRSLPTKAAKETFTIDLKTTAKALTYVKWHETNKLPYVDFEYNTTSTNFTTLEGQIQTEFNKAAGAKIGDQTIPDVTAKALVAEVKNRVVMNRHELYLVTDEEPNQYGPPALDRIGLSFFGVSVGTTTDFRLGNYFHFYDKDGNKNATPNDTKIIAFAGNGIALNTANTVPTEAAWTTNSAAAKGNQAIAAGDVFYFRVQNDGRWQYGVIKVNSITPKPHHIDETDLNFDMKFQRIVADTNLTLVE